jgi:8-oxo-dGTP diphosphatase
MCAARQPGPEATVAVGAVLVNGEGHVLLVRRARPPMQGAWTLPGGRVEPGESLDDAVKREIREEVALDATVVCPLGVVPIRAGGRAYLIHEFLLEAVDRDAVPVAGDDAAEARWVPRETIASLGVEQSAVDVIDRALGEAAARGVSAPGARPG